MPLNRAQRKHEEWIAKKQGKGTWSYDEDHGVKISDAKQEFLDALKNGVSIQIARGIFGPEDANCDAYTTRIKPPEGGTYLKVYGCKYLYRGDAPRIMVFGLQTPKYLLSGFLRDIISKSVLYSGALVLRFLFQRKKFIKDVESFFREINWRAIHWFYQTPETQDHIIRERDYNGFEKELLRAGREAIKGEWWETALELALQYICFFLFLDNAYRFRVQDALEKARSIIEFLDTIISRERGYTSVGETTETGIVHKWKFVKLGIRFALLSSPALRRIEKRLFDKLDKSKVQLDESDWYWCLKNRSYNYGNYSVEQRYKERERLDKVNGTVFLL